MKRTVFIIILSVLSVFAYAQKQTFDVVSYALPKGWQEQKSEAGIQLSATDKKTGAYAVVVITKSMASNLTAYENFNNDWLKLVKGAVQINGEPTIQNPIKENGWDIISGNADYTDGANKGIATLLTATGGNKAVSVVLMTNAKQYQNELLAFMQALKLSKATQISVNNQVIANNANGSSIIGLWRDNHLEVSGYFNGFPQYTAGYFRREYLFKEDGTYTFRLKNWSTLLKEILFASESGTYSVSGNQITITPNKGRGEWWSKKDNNTKLWGNKLGASDYKLEKVNYTFEIKYYSGTNNYGLLLNPKKNTERDGTCNQNGFSYTQSSTGESIIDNPPGFKN
ncbi:hypothetical protein HDC90_000482 [Pedobacter sp. AK013]|uniref:hypothetical protein n=1 Tax=Pedobacter sp. AK013 TaxID=2723071 RepID=UPI0016081204|nr:hypothetical protein [Pedobacter sp. AK013]MBB6235882.1 hypothetical protein [Pedobacter sp. AK013]